VQDLLGNKQKSASIIRQTVFLRDFMEMGFAATLLMADYCKGKNADSGKIPG